MGARTKTKAAGHAPSARAVFAYSRAERRRLFDAVAPHLPPTVRDPERMAAEIALDVERAAARFVATPPRPMARPVRDRLQRFAAACAEMAAEAEGIVGADVESREALALLRAHTGDATAARDATALLLGLGARLTALAAASEAAAESLGSETATGLQTSGRPRNDDALRFAAVLAATWHAATGRRPSRAHDAYTGTDTGPFLEFVEAAMAPTGLLAGISAADVVRWIAAHPAVKAMENSPRPRRE